MLRIGEFRMGGLVLWILKQRLLRVRPRILIANVKKTRRYGSAETPGHKTNPRLNPYFLLMLGAAVFSRIVFHDSCTSDQPVFDDNRRSTLFPH